MGNDVARLRWPRLRVPPLTTQDVVRLTNEPSEAAEAVVVQFFDEQISAVLVNRRARER